jgi:hypothetical protein
MNRTTPSPATANYAAVLNNVTNMINLYYSAIVIPIGVILNMSTIFIFSRSSKVTKTNTILNLLYIGLSVYDILALFNSILFAQLLPSLNIYIVNYSKANCIALNWYRKAVIQSPSWVQVIITFERYLSVCYANKFGLFKRKRNVIVMLVSVFVILTVVNTGHAWFYTVLVTKNATDYAYSGDDSLRILITNSSRTCTSSKIVALVTDFINVAFRFVIPITIMIVLNVLISRNLYKSKKRSKAINKSLKQERNYTLTVAGFNVLFFVLNLPWAVYYVLNYIQSSGIVVFSSSLDDAILGLMNSIVFSIFYLNNLSSFFLNFFFNRVFRKQFVSMTHGAWKLSNVPSSANLPTQLNNTTTNTKNTKNTNNQTVLKY